MSKDRTAREKNREQDDRLGAAEERLMLVEEQADELERSTSSHQGIIGTHSDRIATLDAVDVHLNKRLDALEDRIVALDNRVELLEQPTPPTDPPPPPTRWKTLIDLSRIADWKNTLIAAPGASITEGTFQTRQAIRIEKPNPGERCELHHMDDRLREGAVLRYSWWLYIPSGVPLSTEPDWSVMQQHPDNNGGYGGGIKITRDDRLIVSVKGGERLSAAGSQRYEYELNGKGEGRVEGPDEFGQIRRDRWHHISYVAKWSTEWDGFVRCSLDGGPELVIADVPTYSKIADSQMWRLGYYSASTNHGPLDMYVAGAKIEEPA